MQYSVNVFTTHKMRHRKITTDRHRHRHRSTIITTHTNADNHQQGNQTCIAYNGERPFICSRRIYTLSSSSQAVKHAMQYNETKIKQKQRLPK